MQYVNGFANGADRTLDGDRLSDPTVLKAGQTYKAFSGNPLFASDGFLAQVPDDTPVYVLDGVHPAAPAPPPGTKT